MYMYAYCTLNKARSKYWIIYNRVKNIQKKKRRTVYHAVNVVDKDRCQFSVVAVIWIRRRVQNSLTQGERRRQDAIVRNHAAMLYRHLMKA